MYLKRRLASLVKMHENSGHRFRHNSTHQNKLKDLDASQKKQAYVPPLYILRGALQTAPLGGGGETRHSWRNAQPLPLPFSVLSPKQWQHTPFYAVNLILQCPYSYSQRPRALTQYNRSCGGRTRGPNLAPC
jgi:hypothetical protein